MSESKLDSNGQNGGLTMAKYRKKPVVIEAIRWTGDNYGEIERFIDGATMLRTLHNVNLIIGTFEGDHIASKGDFIIKGVHGEFYPCKPDNFEKTYEYVEG